MDADLLARARAGDLDAVTRIVAAHESVIRSYVARLAPDPVTVDDLAQEVFLAALRSLDRIDPELGVRAYLLGVARNLVKTAWRDRLRNRELSGEALFATLAARDPGSEPPDHAERRLSALQECLRRLPPRMLEVVLRHYREEQRCHEIAHQLGTKGSNVRSILTRSRQALRECLQAKLSGAPA